MFTNNETTDSILHTVVDAEMRIWCIKIDNVLVLHTIPSCRIETVRLVEAKLI
jgi:hypothetical protein